MYKIKFGNYELGHIGNNLMMMKKGDVFQFGEDGSISILNNDNLSKGNLYIQCYINDLQKPDIKIDVGKNNHYQFEVDFVEGSIINDFFNTYFLVPTSRVELSRKKYKWDIEKIIK